MGPAARYPSTDFLAAGSLYCCFLSSPLWFPLYSSTAPIFKPDGMLTSERIMQARPRTAPLGDNGTFQRTTVQPKLLSRRNRSMLHNVQCESLSGSQNPPYFVVSSI